MCFYTNQSHFFFLLLFLFMIIFLTAAVSYSTSTTHLTFTAASSSLATTTTTVPHCHTFPHAIFLRYHLRVHLHRLWPPPPPPPPPPFDYHSLVHSPSIHWYSCSFSRSRAVAIFVPHSVPLLLLSDLLYCTILCALPYACLESFALAISRARVSLLFCSVCLRFCALVQNGFGVSSSRPHAHHHSSASLTHCH